MQYHSILDINLFDIVAPSSTSTMSINGLDEVKNKEVVNDGTTPFSPIPLIQYTPETPLKVSSNLNPSFSPSNIQETDVDIVHEISDTLVSSDSTLIASNLHEHARAFDSLFEMGQYHLPIRSNWGQPPFKYEVDLKSKTKYPISRYVSSHKLSGSYAHFVSQLSIISIPSNFRKL